MQEIDFYLDYVASIAVISLSDIIPNYVRLLKINGYIFVFDNLTLYL